MAAETQLAIGGAGGSASVAGDGVFWPPSYSPLFRLVGDFPFPSSDHRLVWLDVAVPRDRG